MKSEIEITQKLELVKWALLYGAALKKSETRVLKAQLQILEWMLRDDEEDD